MKACGLKVVLEKVDITQERVIDGIVIPSQANQVTRTAKARVVSIGSEATKLDTGIKENDIVIFDFYSVYYNTVDPVVVTNIENVIAQTSVDDPDVMLPLGNRLLTVKAESTIIEKYKGIALPDLSKIDEKWLEIVGFGLKYEGEFKLGDRVKIDPHAKDFIFLMHKGVKYALIHTKDVICMIE